jgi:hypothetical protein
MARVVLLCNCPALRPLQHNSTHEAGVPGLLPVAREQCMPVPAGALRCMLLSIACLGHLQQHPGQGLPHLRGVGVVACVMRHPCPRRLQGDVAPGKDTPDHKWQSPMSHLVRTHQTTNGSHQLLGPRSPLSACLANALLTQFWVLFW